MHIPVNGIGITGKKRLFPNSLFMSLNNALRLRSNSKNARAGLYVLEQCLVSRDNIMDVGVFPLCVRIVF